MKKILVIAIATVLALSLVASASGIVLNIGFSPETSSSLSMGFGYRLDGWCFVAQKNDFSSFVGTWSFGFFWESSGYKVGPVFQFDWASAGEITYSDLMFVVGLKRNFTVGVLSSAIYGQLGFSTSSQITPEIGFELEFDMFRPASNALNWLDVE